MRAYARPCRTPHGVRELKRRHHTRDPQEISRTPHGVRELKRRHHTRDPQEISRTPHGVRELKRVWWRAGGVSAMSHPARGA